MESDFTMLTFERAVQLFQEWGFRVEKGPEQDEVTLILEGSGYRSYYVYEMTHLPKIAAVALMVRQHKDTTEERQFPSRRRPTDGPYGAAQRVLS